MKTVVLQDVTYFKGQPYGPGRVQVPDALAANLAKQKKEGRLPSQPEKPEQEVGPLSQADQFASLQRRVSQLEAALERVLSGQVEGTSLETSGGADDGPEQPGDSFDLPDDLPHRQEVINGLKEGGYEVTLDELLGVENVESLSGLGPKKAPEVQKYLDAIRA